MKVTEDKAKTWTLPMQCPDCKSAVEIETADVYFQSLGSFDEFSIYYSADCGACGTSIDLTKLKLPEFVKKAAKKKR